MADDSMERSNKIQREFNRENRDVLREKESYATEGMHSSHVELIKSLVVLNSGAIVAMLGLAQQLAGKGVPLGPFKPRMLGACFCFLLGIISSAAVYFARMRFFRTIYEAITTGAKTELARKRWGHLMDWGIGIAGCFFIGGALYAISAVAVGIK